MDTVRCREGIGAGGQEKKREGMGGRGGGMVKTYHGGIPKVLSQELSVGSARHDVRNFLF